jgi:hypothetical protein
MDSDHSSTRFDDRHRLMDGVCSVRVAAATARVTRQAVHRWIAQGHLTVVQHADPRGTWIDAAAFARFVATRQDAHAVGVRIETVCHWRRDEAERNEGSHTSTS